MSAVVWSNWNDSTYGITTDSMYKITIHLSEENERQSNVTSKLGSYGGVLRNWQ